MRILLLTSEEWNDYTYSNGVLTNWFAGFDAEFAQIYTSPGMPNNNICHRYFRITDGEMARSIFTRKKVGQVIQMAETTEALEASKVNAKREGTYGVMKKISLWFHTPVVLLRDFIWLNGKYNIEGLRKFIDDFNPDIVFSPRYASPKMMRLENVVHQLTNVPMVAFTADDEASLRQYSLSPLYWVRRLWINRMFTRHVKGFYKHYWTFSEDQANEYRSQYGLTTSTLYKCGDFPETYVEKEINKPIRLVYAGRLYCNRWKTLAEIGKALQVINKAGEQMVLDIYAVEKVTKRQRKALCPQYSINIHGRVAPEELVDIYKKADIALHVEAMDKRNRLSTRVSFSTKIIDLMASTCAIMAICWNQHAGYQYLKKNDAAFCIDDYSAILPCLQSIAETPSLIQTYAKKALVCGKENHSRQKIHEQIRSKFQEIIDNNK